MSLFVKNYYKKKGQVRVKVGMELWTREKMVLLRSMKGIGKKNLELGVGLLGIKGTGQVKVWNWKLSE